MILSFHNNNGHWFYGQKHAQHIVFSLLENEPADNKETGGLTATGALYNMMTSSKGNIFRVTGPLCGEFTGHRRIPLTKASDAELWCFLWSAPWIDGWVNNRGAGDLRRHRAHYDVIMMKLFVYWLQRDIHVLWKVHVTLLSRSSQHVGCWWPGAYFAPGHRQPSWWRRQEEGPGV